MLEQFLSKLGASTRITIGVSISPNVGLEMIEIDRTTGTVSRYAHKPLEYDHSNREIKDYDQFKSSLEDLFEELHIPKKSNIVLNVPNVLFGTINLPLLLTDDAISSAIMSEAEQSYIFKRQEPVVSWMEIGSNIDTENRSLAYAAIQKPSLDKIQEVCHEIGCTLVCVENSYISLLRALHYTNTTKDQMKENTTWNLMIIGQNSYSLLSMVDKKIIEYYEEPLALKSFVDDEIYKAITTSAQLTLAGLPANHLLIVSETDLVSAEVLSLKIPFEGQISFLECNKYVQNDFIPVNLNILPNIASHLTPEAVGATVYPFSDFKLKMNLIQESELPSGTGDSDEVIRYHSINIGNVEVELTPDLIKKISLIIGGIIIVPMIIISLLLNNLIIPAEQTKLTNLELKISQTKEAIAEYSKAGKDETFDLNATMDKIGLQNRNKLFYYSALGVSIPNKLWITYYMTNEADKVDIRGRSTNVESIYTFYKNIKQLVNNSDIRLYKLEISSESIDDVVGNISSGPKTYQFEITNMSESELNPAAAPAATATAPTETKETPQPGFQLGKPLFGPKPPQPDPAAAPVTPAPPGTVAPNPTPPGTEQLPKNLEKIEKF